MTTKISQYFTADEFACKCGMCDAKIDMYFVLRLDDLRKAYGKPLMITSGVRCESHNKAIGGAKSSKHLLGIAADIYCELATDRYRLLQLAYAQRFTGIGIAHNFIHLDIRATDPVTWLYDFPKQKATLKRAG